MTKHICILDFTNGADRLSLSELYGHVEVAVSQTDTEGALALLNGLITGPGKDSVTLKAEDIVIADRDRVLAEIYKFAYGPKIRSTVTCNACSSHFDLDFDLNDLQDFTLQNINEAAIEKLGDNEFKAANGSIFRLPTGQDELEVAGWPAEEASQKLLQRCIIGNLPEADIEIVETGMESIAPLLDTDLAAHCPECANEQQVHFSIQSFLLARLMQEQPVVIKEIQTVASYYGWGYNEILNLPRSLRRKFANMIDS